MAQNTMVELDDQTVTELTDADITSLTLQNMGGAYVRIYCTTGSAPQADDAHILLPPYALLVNEGLSDLFPGVASGDRVFAWTNHEGAQVFISHE